MFRTAIWRFVRTCARACAMRAHAYSSMARATIARARWRRHSPGASRIHILYINDKLIILTCLAWRRARCQRFFLMVTRRTFQDMVVCLFFHRSQRARQRRWTVQFWQNNHPTCYYSSVWRGAWRLLAGGMIYMFSCQLHVPSNKRYLVFIWRSVFCPCAYCCCM